MNNPPELPPPVARRTSRYAVASLIIGILSFIAGYFGVLTGLVGAVLGILAVGHIGAAKQLTGRGLAITGSILGSLAVIFTLTIYDWNSLFHRSPDRESHLYGPAHVP